VRGNELIAFGNDCALLLNDRLFDLIVLLLGSVPQLLQLPLPLLDAHRSRLLHLLQLLDLVIYPTQVLLQFALYLLPLLLNGIRLMALVAAIDEALRTDEGVIASLANVHNGVLTMPIAGPLKITVILYHALCLRFG
jgi:hypothetical protein